MAHGHPPILALDFDGTIVEHKFPEVGELMPDAKATIKLLHEKGCRIIIWTCRKGPYVMRAGEFLLENGIPFDYINTNVPEINFTSKKIYADYYIDDKNLGGFPGWPEVFKIVMKDDYFKKAASHDK